MSRPSTKNIHLSGEENTEPKQNDSVKIAYIGTMGEEDDKIEFDRNEEGFTFNVGMGSVIQCWDEQIMTMNVGEKATITCPAETAYGEERVGPIPPNTDLTFEVWRKK